MIYVLVCLLKDPVLQFHDRLVGEVCSTFNVKRQKLPAHFTIKAPFETDDISEVETLTENFCKIHSSSDLSIDGYGAFRKNVVYMKIRPSEKAKSVTNQYLDELKGLEWLEWKSNEKGEKVYHCTVVSKLREEKFHEIWNYVIQKPCSFETDYDNITIMVWNRDKWEVHKEFQLQR